jgi:uncharacterized protein
MAKAIDMSSSLQPFLHAKKDSSINRLLVQRPDTVGVIVWPYQCKSWDAKTRLKKIEEHYSVIEEFCPKLDFHVDGALKLMNLGSIYENLHVVIDRPKWFMREGQLVINLFLADVRIYSLAFSFARESGKVVAYVGALQGRSLEGIRDLYRKITKSLYGMRPQDFLFELFRIFCRTVGVTKILAVSESYRHHRSSYFSKEEYFATSTLNYDRIWFERGGTLENPDFFVLGVEPHLKNMEEIPSNKRSMYRQRYQLLEVIEVRIQDAYVHLGDNRFLEYPFHSF